MAFKDLFIVSEDKSKDKKTKDTKKETYTSKFPSSSEPAKSFGGGTKSGFPVMEVSTDEAPPIPTLNVPLECASQMDSIMELYEKGFEKLNQPGIEFFEFFQAVVDAGADNPPAYKMAMKLLMSMEKTMTKNSLITQSQF